MDEFVTDRLINKLHANGPLRVWSIVITIFGDCIVPHGGRVSAATLSAITQGLRIEPVALRSALSRLAKEGWIVREKQGRHSFYTLSEAGLNSFAPATRRIYAKNGPPMPDNWTIAMSAPLSLSQRAKQKSEMEAIGYISLDDRLYVGTNVTDASGITGEPAIISGKFTSIPPWLSQTIGADKTAADYREIMTQFSDISGYQTPLNALLTRILLVHEWRRVLFHHADLPAAFFPTDWPAEACRDFVAETYLGLSVAAENWLNKVPELSAPNVDYGHRFIQ